MDFKELVRKNRSFRRFDESFKIEKQTLKDLIDLARLTPSSKNLQLVRYVISCDKERNSRIFPHLGWARYIPNWEGPEEGERPTAYIIILGDTTIKAAPNYGYGIAAQTIMLGAVEKGLGGCMIRTIDTYHLRLELAIPDRYEILMMLALGKPAEKVVIEPLDEAGHVAYWRDEEGVHHVPKRSLDDIILDL